MTVIVRTVKPEMEEKKNLELNLRIHARIIQAKLRSLTCILAIVGLLQIISGMHGMYDIVQYGQRAPHQHHYFNCLPETWEMGAFECNLEIVLGMLLLGALMLKHPDQYILLWISINICLSIISWTTLICAFSREQGPSTIVSYGTLWMILTFSQLTFGLLYFKKLEERRAVNKVLEWTNRQKLARSGGTNSKYFQVEKEKLDIIPEEAV